MFQGFRAWSRCSVAFEFHAVLGGFKVLGYRVKGPVSRALGGLRVYRGIRITGCKGLSVRELGGAPYKFRKISPKHHMRVVVKI